MLDLTDYAFESKNSIKQYKKAIKFCSEAKKKLNFSSFIKKIFNFDTVKQNHSPNYTHL